MPRTFSFKGKVLIKDRVSQRDPVLFVLISDLLYTNNIGISNYLVFSNIWEDFFIEQSTQLLLFRIKDSKVDPSYVY